MYNGRKETWAWPETVSVGTFKCNGPTGTNEGGEERGRQLVKSSCAECNVCCVGKLARVV